MWGITVKGRRVSKLPEWGIIKDVVNKLGNKPVDEIFMVKYDDVKFDARPFIMNVCSLYDDVMCIAAERYLKHNSCYLDTDFVSKFSEENAEYLNIFRSLLPCARGIRESCALLNWKSPRSFLMLAAEVAFTCILTDSTGFEVYEGVFGTMEFCRYITMYWIYNLSPRVRGCLQGFYRYHHVRDYMEKIFNDCPDLVKYVKGDMWANTVYKHYTEEKFSDGSSVMQRETVAVLQDGYDGRDLTFIEQTLANKVYDNFINGCMNGSILYEFVGMWSLISGENNALDNELKAVKLQCDELNKQVKSGSAKCKDLKAKLLEANNHIKEVDSEISRLKSDLALLEKQSDTTVLDNLKAEVHSLQLDNNRLLNDYLSLRKDYSSAVKKVKQLSALVPDNEAKLDSTPDVEKAVIGVDEMARLISGKNILIVGGCGVGNIQAKLEQFGLCNVRHECGIINDIGSCDCAVILTTTVSHSAVWRVEKFQKGMGFPIVYVNGVNSEMIIREVYNEFYGK